MRLHRLELQAFLAFPGREVVDFDALNAAGLFLLTGRTGAGKTAILDAICFALYGQVPGDRGIKRLRSDHAPVDTATEVVLELTLRGRRLRVTRRPEQERRALRGAGMTTAKAEVRLDAVAPDGSAEPLANRHEEVGQELQDVLRMTRDQFCQVVLLPQGGFQRFLHAPTREREPLLRELFDVERFGDLEKWLDGQRIQAGREAESALREVRGTVSAAAHVVDTAPAGTLAPPPTDWERTPSSAQEWLAEQAVVAEAQATTAVEALTDATRTREFAEKTHADACALQARQTAAAEASAALAAWEARRGTRDQAQSRLRAARAAAPADVLVRAWHERTARADAATAAGQQALAAARAAGVPLPALDAPASVAPALTGLADGLRSDAGAIRALLPVEEQVDRERLALQALRRRITGLGRSIEEDEGRLGGARTEVARLETAAQAAQEAAGQADALRGIAEVAAARAGAAELRDRLAAQVTQATERFTGARELAVAAREEHLRLLGEHLDGIAAVLAARLQDGEPCAVCGSSEHPSPAPDHGTVAQDAVDAAKLRADELATVRDTCAGQLAELREEHAGALGEAGRSALAELRDAAADAHRRATAAATLAVGVGTTTGRLVAGRAAVVELEETVQAARLELAGVTADRAGRASALEDDLARVESGRAGAPTLGARLADLETAAAAADDAAEAIAAAVRATVEARDAQDAAAAAAQRAGFPSLDALAQALLDDEQGDLLEQQVRDHDTTMAERRAAAARPELVEAMAQPAARVDAAAAALRRAKPAEAAAQDLQHAAVSRRGQLRGLAERLAQELERTGPLLQRRALMTDLAELATGRGSANRLNMSLSVYVLAARLEEVAAAATARLLEMTDGRFALEHADDTGKGRSLGGLDLVVADHWNGTRRPPATLSGGETFMASLALALGLADVVAAQSGGVRLETLFVDEGFGSLDDEGTLDGVLEALDALREGGRTVGVVSHVGELRQRIPTQVRVEKGRNGSRILAATSTPA